MDLQHTAADQHFQVETGDWWLQPYTTKLYNDYNVANYPVLYPKLALRIQNDAQAFTGLYQEIFSQVLYFMIVTQQFHNV